jgi:hypothetical protein
MKRAMEEAIPGAPTMMEAANVLPDTPGAATPADIANQH